MSETTSGAAPTQFEMDEDTPAVAATADGNCIVGVCEQAGIVESVEYAPVANVTGAAGDTRTLTLVNKGQDGNGAVTIATLALLLNTNLTDYNKTALVLSGTAANLVVAAGDVLAFVSTHSGSDGLADPGGNVTVTYRTD